MVDEIRAAGVYREELDELIQSQSEQGDLRDKFLYKQDVRAGKLAVSNGAVDVKRIDGKNVQDPASSRNATRGMMRSLLTRKSGTGYGLSQTEADEVLKKMDTQHAREVKKLEAKRPKTLFEKIFGARKKEYPYSLKTIDVGLQEARRIESKSALRRNLEAGFDGAGKAAKKMKGNTSNWFMDMLWNLFAFCSPSDDSDEK